MNNPENVTREEKILTSRLNVTHQRLHTYGRAYEQTRIDYGDVFPLMVYQGEVVYHKLFSAIRDINPLLKSLKNFERIKASGEVLNHFKKMDYFEIKTRGVSLLDIENLSLPLISESIKKLDKIFLNLPRFISKFNKKRNSEIQYSICMFPTQLIARIEEKQQIPRNLLPLSQRLVQYLDNYVEIIKNGQSSSALWEIKTAGKLASRSVLIQLLGSYLPARLKITPSSAIKLFRDRFDFALYFNISRRGLIDVFENDAKYAYRPGALPNDLIKYIHFNEETDLRATVLLALEYKDYLDNDQNKSEAFEEVKNLKERLEKFSKFIHSDVQRSNGRRLTFEFKNNSQIRELILTHQNRDVFILIYRFKDNSTHLTLEINKNGEVFGLPLSLETSHPFVADFLLRDSLSLILDRADQLHPKIERPLETLQAKTGKPKEVLSNTPVVIFQAPFSRKRKNRIETTSNSSSKEEFILELPEIPKMPEKKFVILNSEEEIRELIGRHPREKDVQRVMNQINKFETGLLPPYKTIDWSEGHAQILMVGRDIRVVMLHQGRGFYRVAAVGDREYVYENFADYKG